jgi:Tol biopolymer transport system component/polyisoprenoid-binding protein YceI
MMKMLHIPQRSVLALIFVAVLLCACQAGATTAVPTPAATVAPAAVLGSTAGPAAGMRTFRIVPELTEASYAVREKFFERPLPNLAIGRTHSVAGAFEFSLDGQPAGGVVTMTVDLRTIRSDARNRDGAMREILETDKYPIAEFRSTGAQNLPNRYQEGQEVAFKLVGVLKIHGVERPATFDVRGTLAGATVTGSATTIISMKDYGIDMPSFLGLTVDDSVTLTLRFTARDAGAAPGTAAAAATATPATTPAAVVIASEIGPVLGARGLLAFLSQRDGNEELYLASTSGAAPVRLTSSPADESGIAWSPDGSKIAFVSGAELMSARNAEIYVVDLEALTPGAAPTRLTDNQAGDYSPTWSPDASRIAFVSERDGNSEIYVMNADGSAPTRLTRNAWRDSQPVWSPDGARIAFVSGDERTDIYVLNADGSDQVKLTDSFAADHDPAWSPDGSRIAFVSGDRNTEIHMIDADGSQNRQLTSASGLDVSPVWSPDGGTIAFRSHRDGNSEIYVMNADGSGQINLTNHPADDEFPAWSPDGRTIAFASDRDGAFDLYLMNADGSSAARLIDDPAEAGGPVWQP